MKPSKWVRGTVAALVWLTLFGIVTETIHAESPRETGARTKVIRSKARLCTQWLYSGRYDLLWANGTDILMNTFGSREFFEMIMREKLPDPGNNIIIEDQVWNERLQTTDNSYFYERGVNFKDIDGRWSIEWGLDSKLRILYLDIRLLPEEAPSDYLDYRTKTPLQLPFAGKWAVLWGGRSIQDNYHADSKTQRFAYDFFVFRDGYYYRGDGTSNEDHYCFDKPILAPGQGVVVEAVSDVPDNFPGASDNMSAPLGNYVILDHQNGEYSFLCHFKQGSVAVRKGQRVIAGEFLGRCGNSGASDIPHLHYHLQNTPDPFPYFPDNPQEDRKWQGLPAQFRCYRTDDSPIWRGEPVRGQEIRNGVSRIPRPFKSVIVNADDDQEETVP
jgi:hypothetical protein